jgi:uncharacterized protein YpbB
MLLNKDEKHKQVIQCYASTNDHDEDNKDAFHQKLQATLDKLKNKDINILMGDSDAKVGSDNTGYEVSR